jgi:serine/threonine protein kinase
MKFKDNPNIIKIQDLIRIDKIIYLVLEYCNDKDITSYFKKLRYESGSSSEIKFNDGKKPKSQI